MKKGRLFAKIIYYLFVFLLGVLIAISLPVILYSSNKDAFIADSLQSEDYQSAIQLLVPYYNTKYVSVNDINGGGKVVLFEATVESETTGERYNSYFGFLYGVKGIYNTYSTGNNQTMLVVTTLSGEKADIELLDYNQDEDEQGTLDCVWAIETNGYTYFDLPNTRLESVATLDFYDKDGQLLGGSSIDLTSLQLDFSSQYFVDAKEMNDAYNAKLDEWTLASKDTSVSDSQLEQIKKELSDLNKQLHENFISKSDSYATFEIPKGLKSIVVPKEVAIIVSYFVAVYIIGDFLLGSHYIIKFFRWFLYKVCKIQPKNKQKLKKDEVFGHDYYSSVTMTLDTESVPEFNESVQIKYTNSDVEVVFILLKQNNYTATQRIKAGTYVNPFIDMNRDYAPTNLPDNLEVEGYKMDIKIKIIKREV